MTNIPVNELKQALKIIKSIAPKGRCIMPILETMRLDLYANGLTLTATDLEQYGSITIGESDTFTNKALCVNIKQFEQAIKSLKPKDFVSIEIETYRITVNGIKFAGISVDEFPGRPEFKMWDGYAPHLNFLLTSHCKEDLKDCLVTASQDETRFNLVSVCFKAVSKHSTEIVSTDGHRMTVREYIGTCKRSDSKSARDHHIIPVCVIKTLLLLPDNTEITINEKGTVLVSIENRVSYCARTIEGEYPRYDQVLPDISKLPLKIEGISAALLLDACEKVLTVDKTHCPTAKIEISKENSMRIYGSSAEHGSCDITFNDFKTNGHITFGVNARYIAEFLKTLIPDSTVTIHAKDSLCGIVLKRNNHDSGTFLVMPIRL